MRSTSWRDRTAACECCQLFQRGPHDPIPKTGRSWCCSRTHPERRTLLLAAPRPATNVRWRVSSCAGARRAGLRWAAHAASRSAGRAKPRSTCGSLGASGSHGKNEGTQGDWKRVSGDLPGELTAELPAGDDFPVGNVNFAEAEGFCRKLTQLAIASKELPADWEFRLPTEAQWEYACRAGTTTATAFGDSLSRRQANFRGKPYNGGADDGPSLKRASRVGSYPPNAWGLHDMHGNTFEWCRDWYHPALPGGDDPDLYSAKAVSRVRRGGCWADEGWPCRSAFRLRFEPERRYDHIGFRVVAASRR